MLTSKLKDFTRVVDLQTQFNELFRYTAFTESNFAVIEGFAYGNHYTLVPLVEITTALKLVLHTKGIPFILVAPTTLKKCITGKGNATKERMRTQLETDYGITEKNDDIIDAISLAIFGMYVCDYQNVTKNISPAQLKGFHTLLCEYGVINN